MASERDDLGGLLGWATLGILGPLAYWLLVRDEAPDIDLAILTFTIVAVVVGFITLYTWPKGSGKGIPSGIGFGLIFAAVAIWGDRPTGAMIVVAAAGGLLVGQSLGRLWLILRSRRDRPD